MNQAQGSQDQVDVAASIIMGDPSAVEAGTEERNMLVDELSDRLAAFRGLAKDDDASQDAILSEFGATGKVEADILTELAAIRPLYMPHRFEEAHHLMMRALEVLDRNGARPAKMPRLGVLAPVAGFFVQLVARFIVRNYQAELITQLRNLYVRREANSPKDSPERFMLRRARIDAERMLPTLKKNPLGVPTFLFGGAVISWISSSLGRAADSAKSQVGMLIALGVVFGLFAALSWAVLRGAAVARNRIRMSVEQPLKALWEIIGVAGRPPKDSSKQFALIAIILTGVGFLLIPIGLAVAFLG